ncbi:MAG: hypothetical protein ACYS8L_08035 [Planctomycetota bacterium]|jgi:hypothetical protein
MASVFNDGTIPVSFRTDADLSAKQYYAVRAASTVGYVNTANGASNGGPVGVLQDSDGDTIGDVVGVILEGPTKGVCAACDIAGNACVIKFGTFLRTGSNGQFYARGAAQGQTNARALESLTTGSAILHIYFFQNAGSGLAAS